MILNKSKGSHLYFVDGLRALTAIYVVMHHVMIHYFDPFNFESYGLSGIKRMTVTFFFSGHYAVNFFIVISGFSLMLSALKNDYRYKKGVLVFIQHRIKRIVPPYYLAMLLSLLLIWLFIGNKTGTHWDISIPVSIADILAHLFMVHDFFMSTVTTINHAFWSISVEFRVYLFFPVLLMLWRRFGSISTMIAAIVISSFGLIILIYLKNHIEDNINAYFAGVSPYLILFFTGMLAADLALSDRAHAVSFRSLFHRSLNWQQLILLLLSLMLFKVTTYLIWRYIREGSSLMYVASQLVDVILGVSYAAVLFLCTVSTAANKTTYWLKITLSWKPLIFIGGFSYSIYLIHSPLIQIVSQYIIDPLKLPIYTASWLLMLISVPGILCFSYFFFYVCERPFMTVKLKKASLDIKSI